jgi:hypothetical protein
MIRKYEKEISVPENHENELVGRACLFFANSYPKDSDSIWWKIPEAFKQVIGEAYRRGFAEGAGIKEVDGKGCDK